MSILNTEAVYDIMKETLFKDEELNYGAPIEDAIIVNGLVNNYGFHPDRVMAAKLKIDRLLRELPEQFRKDKGGGWSFLNACEDKNGCLWGEHKAMEALVCLGIAVGSASWILKDMAASLPGGMPYFEIHPDEIHPKEKSDVDS